MLNNTGLIIFDWLHWDRDNNWSTYNGTEGSMHWFLLGKMIVCFFFFVCIFFVRIDNKKKKNPS